MGLQVLLWTLSGLIFAWLDHHQVSAEHSVRKVEPKQISSNAPLAEPSIWLAGSATAFYDIQLTFLLDEPVWRVEQAADVALYGMDRSPILLDERLVGELALRRYIGTGALKSVSFEMARHGGDRRRRCLACRVRRSRTHDHVLRGTRCPTRRDAQQHVALVRLFLDVAHHGLSRSRQLQQSARDYDRNRSAVAFIERVPACLPQLRKRGLPSPSSGSLVDAPIIESEWAASA